LLSFYLLNQLVYVYNFLTCVTMIRITYSSRITSLVFVVFREEAVTEAERECGRGVGREARELDVSRSVTS
jgi:hypothetical protein